MLRHGARLQSHGGSLTAPTQLRFQAQRRARLAMTAEPRSRRRRRFVYHRSSRGIGAATQTPFVRAGARVAFNYLHGAEADQMVKECGADLCHARGDLTGTAGAEALRL